jgi:hypothetical protein
MIDSGRRGPRNGSVHPCRSGLPCITSRFAEKEDRANRATSCAFFESSLPCSQKCRLLCYIKVEVDKFETFYFVWGGESTMDLGPNNSKTNGNGKWYVPMRQIRISSHHY